LLLEKERDKNSPLRMRVYAASRATLRESSNEQRGTLGRLESRWRAEVDALLGIDLLGEFEDVDIFRFHKFFLDARGCEVDEVTAER
jgi:hypothetical protein